MGILNTIKQKPENQKKVMSLVLALILTLFIVGLWFSFSYNSSNETAGGEQNKLSSVSPWQVVKDEFSKAFSGLKGEMFDTTEESSTTVQVEIVSDDLIDNSASSSDEIISTSTATSSIELE